MRKTTTLAALGALAIACSAPALAAGPEDRMEGPPRYDRGPPPGRGYGPPPGDEGYGRPGMRGRGASPEDADGPDDGDDEDDDQG